MKEIPHTVRQLLVRREIPLWTVQVLAEVGSSAHGISVGDPDNDDLDLTAIRMEEWRELVLGPESRQSMMIRTQPDGHRSRMGDIDLNVYTLRKFARLAAKGNPSILTVLFSPNMYAADRGRAWVEGLQSRVPSRRHADAFIGYMTQQLDRWQGGASKKVNRPELIERYGYDTKYAGHVFRLGLQGAEYLRTGRFTLPMPTGQRLLVKAVREGELREFEALDIAYELLAELRRAEKESPLPPENNLAGVDSFMAGEYSYWFIE